MYCIYSRPHYRQIRPVSSIRARPNEEPGFYPKVHIEDSNGYGDQISTDTSRKKRL